MRPRRSRDRAWHHPLERVWCISIRSWLLLCSSQLRIRRLRSLWDASFDVPYDDGDDVEDQGDDPHNLSGPVRTLQAEVVARLDGGELYGDALHQEEANQKTGNAKHYTDRRPHSLELAPIGSNTSCDADTDPRSYGELLKLPHSKETLRAPTPTLRSEEHT